MLKKIWKTRFICFMVVFSLLLPYSAAAADIPDEESKPSQILNEELRLKTAREQIVFETKVEESIQEYDVEHELSISQIKSAQDFAGNRYTIIECEPTGYYIYHNDSGTFVEYSPESLSPYLGKTGSFYYSGPMGYYVKQGDTIQNTLTEEIYPGSIATEAMVASEEMTQRLIENKDTGTLDFVDGQVPISAYIRSNEIMAANGIIKYVENSSFISGLTSKAQIGYFKENDGCCGYIAAGIVLHYWHRRNPSRNIIPSVYLGTTGFNGAAFNRSLYSIGKSLGFSSDTVPWQIRDVLNKYCSDKRISATSGWWAGSLYASSEVQQNRPVILFGKFNQPTGGSIPHAVVMYGINTVGGNAQVHFGWEGYSNITLSVNAIAGNTNFRLN